jgi:hypothetical protein
MKSSFNSTIKDPLIKDLIKAAAVVVAFVVAVIGVKTLIRYFNKK